MFSMLFLGNALADQRNQIRRVLSTILIERSAAYQLLLKKAMEIDPYVGIKARCHQVEWCCIVD